MGCTLAVFAGRRSNEGGSARRGIIELRNSCAVKLRAVQRFSLHPQGGHLLLVEPVVTPASGEAHGVLGVRLGKYVLDARLGEGGMAEVFRAHTVGAEGFERPVAIKRVLPDASRNPAFSEMFIAEAKLSARLQHPNIVAVLDFDRDAESRLYLVMELVDGRDLNDLIETGPMPFSTVIYVVAEMLRGLGYAHNLPVMEDGLRGLVHRDVSPHNVLCSWNGAVKVSDFGIAKARQATAASASIVVKGKPAYMSPEQVRGAALDGRSDLFAVGVMLWQMLTGQYLFAAASMTETLGRVLFGNVALPRTLVPDVPEDLQAVTMRLLEREPSRRFSVAEDVIGALLACRDAPRDGARELEQLLVARFPDRAPVRERRWMGGALPDRPAAIAHGTPGTAELGPRGTVPLRAPVAEPEVHPPQSDAVRPHADRRRAWAAVGASVLLLAGVAAASMALSADQRGAEHAPLAPADAVTPDSAASAHDASTSQSPDASYEPTAIVDAGDDVDARKRDAITKPSGSASARPSQIHIIPMSEENQ